MTEAIAMIEALREELAEIRDDKHNWIGAGMPAAISVYRDRADAADLKAAYITSVMQDIATQLLSDELIEKHGGDIYRGTDFEAAYSLIVLKARAAISYQPADIQSQITWSK